MVSYSPLLTLFSPAAPNVINLRKSAQKELIFLYCIVVRLILKIYLKILMYMIYCSVR